MALPPQKFREIVFQVLYTCTYEGSDPEATALMLMAELRVTRRSVLEACSRVRLIEEKLPQIDGEISSTSTEYSFDRISRIEKTILRLALYEILFDPSIPPRVAIAEAIRLTRKFGTPESSQFVNAILDQIYKNKHGTLLSNEPAPV